MGDVSKPEEVSSLEAWREQTTRQVLLMMTAAAPIPLAYALVRPSVTWSLAPALVYLLAYAMVLLALAGRRLPQLIRGWLAVLPFLLLATVSLMRTGWVGNGRFLLLVAVLQAFVLLGPRAGWTVAGIAVAVYASFALAAQVRLLDQAFVPPEHPLSLGDWTYYGIVVLALMAPTLGYLARYERFQAALAKRWRLLALRLSDEVTRRRKVEAAFLDFTERERRHLGIELHDGLCQQIAGSRLICTSLEGRLAAEGSPAADRLRSLGESLEEALDQAYELARGLGSEVAPDGLPEALESLARRTEDRFEVACTFEQEGDCLMEAETATQILRIVQEAVSNAVRHARPSRVRILLTCRQDWVTLGVEDDGEGFSSRVPRGLGLGAMEHRAERIGGRLEIVSDTAGTRVRCAAPAWRDAREIA